MTITITIDRFHGKIYTSLSEENRNKIYTSLSEENSKGSHVAHPFTI